jgi:hypothetical protein
MTMATARLVEIKDDKNNNNLSALVETLELAQLTTSSVPTNQTSTLSSNENSNHHIINNENDFNATSKLTASTLIVS